MTPQLESSALTHNLLLKLRAIVFRDWLFCDDDQEDAIWILWSALNKLSGKADRLYDVPPDMWFDAEEMALVSHAIYVHPFDQGKRLAALLGIPEAAHA